MKTFRRLHPASPSFLPAILAWAALACPALHAQLLPPAFPTGATAPTFYVGYELLSGTTELGLSWNPPITSGGYLVSEEPASVSQSLAGPGLEFVAISQARAGFDGLGVASSAAVSGLFNLAGSGAVVQSPDGLPHYGSLAAVIWHDNIVSGPGSLASVSLNLRLDGSETLNHSPTSPLPGKSLAAVLETGLGIVVQVSYTLPGGPETVIQFEGAYAHSEGSPDLFLATGLLTGFSGTGDFVITTPAFDVPVGVPTALSLVLASAAAAGTTQLDSENAFAAMDFLHTLTFPTDGPVLNLEPGLNYNAPSMGIIDNQFEAVPEPETWGAMLVVAGLTVATWLRRRRSVS